MAKILYGVAGQGFGHSSRSELLGQRLVEAGHDVLFAASQKSLDYLKPTFGERVKDVHGLSFYYHDGRVRPLLTLWQNFSQYSRGFRKNRYLFKNVVKDFKPDLVISDFEPFSSWWAWRNGVPSVSIDHEHFLTCCRLDKERGMFTERLMAKIVTRGYHTYADAYLIINFFKTPLINRRAILTPPVVRNIVLQYQPTPGEHIVMYSTDSGKKMKDRLFEAIRRFKDYRFHIYGFNEHHEQDNCIFKKTSTEGFMEDLASCRGVIATAGFSLLSELLHFRKPMLLAPVQDQYEQLINAYYIEKLGLGCRTQGVDSASVGAFLDKIDTLNITSDVNPLVEFPDNEKFYRIVDETIRQVGFTLNIASPGQHSGSGLPETPKESDNPPVNKSRAL